ncbi:MAG: protein kinase [Myxococcales bacterium]|nr:protein kinase [Myxococcales bacterium]
MGSVYRARDLRSGDAVAIKIQTGHGERQRRRWAREAMLLAKLSGPDIVRYLAHGETPTGELYLAMEWLEGEDLAARLDREGLSLSESIGVVKQVAAALQPVHAQGIAHRDIKPSNIFLVDGDVGRVKVIDFGIARVGGSTRSRTYFGTPGYVAPEQARGDASVDARADVFALGCVLFECLTGRPAFVADHVMALLGKILLEDAPRPSDIRHDLPPGLDDLVLRLLAKDPGARPRDGGAVAAQLEALEIGVDLVGRAVQRGPAVLTNQEQRLVFIVLAAGAEAPVEQDLTRRTLDESVDVAPEVRSLARAYGADAAPLADGSTVLVLESGGTASDQAVHAARCALALHAMKPQTALALAVGRSAVGNRLPLGAVIDRATALVKQLRDEPRPVLIDDALVGLLETRFELSEHAGSVRLEGEKRRLELPRTLLGKPTPCVGRDRELGELESIVTECIDERVSRAVLITAAAGVGKSRLLHELHVRLRTRTSAPEVWTGRGDPMHAGSPFSLLAHAIRGATEAHEGEPLEVRRARIRARIARHVPKADRARVAEFIGELVGTPFPDEDSVQLRAARGDAMLMRDHLGRAWREWLAAEAAATPILLVFEDVHWGDLPSLLLVDAALRSVRDKPWMVLAIGRPDVHEVFPRLWVDRRVRELRLDEISARASEQLIRSSLVDASAETIARLVARAAGIPFYLEELIRAEAVGRGSRVPETVLAMLQARLERLAPEIRRTLRAASIFGSRFHRGGIARLCGADAHVGEALAQLEENELVESRGDGRFPGDAEHVFRHALVREAAYSTLTEQDRVLGHKLAGQWLEERGEPDAMTLAEHFERGQDSAAAVRWYRRASEQALEGSDLDAAISRAERGIACGATGEPLGVLRLVQSEAYLWRGDLASSEREATLAMKDLPPGGARWYKAALGLLMQSASLGREDQIELFIRQLAASPTTERSGAQTMAFALAHRLLAMTGQRGLAHMFFERLEAIDRDAHGEPSITAMVPGGQFSWWSYIDWDPWARLLACERCAVECELVGDGMNLAMARIHIGWARVSVGAFAEGEQILRETLALATANGLEGLVADFAMIHLGSALARLDRLEEARAVELEAIPRLFAAGNWMFGGLARAELAKILLREGDLQAALEEARAAAGALTRVPAVRIGALAILSRASLACGDTAAALGAAREGVDLLEQLGIVTESEPLLRLAHADALCAHGDPRAGIAAIHQAAARLTERAARIPDQAMRRRMLVEIPEHVEILQRAASSS